MPCSPLPCSPAFGAVPSLPWPGTGCRYQKLACGKRKIRPRELMLPVRQPACRTLVIAWCLHHPSRPRRNSARGSIVEPRGLRAKEGDPASSAGNASLSRSSFVPVMESSHFRDLDHRSKFGRLNRSRLRRIFRQRQMRARMPIVGEIPPTAPGRSATTATSSATCTIPTPVRTNISTFTGVTL